MGATPRPALNRQIASVNITDASSSSLMMPVLVASTALGMVALMLPISHHCQIRCAVILPVAINMMNLHVGHIMPKVMHHFAMLKGIPM
jgi:hypothetical protein